MSNVLTVTLEDLKERIPEGEAKEELFELLCASKSQFELFMTAMKNGVHMTSEEAAQLNSEIQKLHEEAAEE